MRCVTRLGTGELACSGVAYTYPEERHQSPLAITAEIVSISSERCLV